QRGKDATTFPLTLASYAARAVRCGRRVCGQERAKDALSSVAQRRHNFSVQRLPQHETGVDDNASIDALADPKTPPPLRAAFRIDYRAWLSRLPRRKRLIAQDMAMGEGTRDLAVKHKVSQGRISQLRRELHSDWRRFHGEID